MKKNNFYNLENFFVSLLVSILLQFKAISYAIDDNLMQAILHNDIVTIQYLLLLDLNSDSLMKLDENGSTALHLASEKGSQEAVELLLSHNVTDAFLMHANHNGWTALHVACYRGHKAIIAVLLSKNASFDFLKLGDRNGYTVLHIACWLGYKNILELLLFSNVSSAQKLLMQVNIIGWTGLHFAADKGHLAIVEFLVSTAPSLLWQNTYLSHSALKLAFDQEQYSVAEYLIEKSKEFSTAFNRAKVNHIPFESFENLDTFFKVLLTNLDVCTKNNSEINIKLEEEDLRCKDLEKQLLEAKAAHCEIFQKSIQQNKILKDLEKEVERARLRILENKNKALDFFQATADEYKNKNLLPLSFEHAYMKNFYEDLTKEQLIEVVNNLREQTASMKDCPSLATRILDFLKTGKQPIPIVWAPQDMGLQECDNVSEPEDMSLEGRGSKRRKIFDAGAITEVNIGAEFYNKAMQDEDAHRNLLLDVPESAAHLGEVVDFSNKPSQLMSLDVLDEVLKKQAKGNKYRIAFGLIHLSCLEDSHQAFGVEHFVYFARPSVIYFIDVQHREKIASPGVFESSCDLKSTDAAATKNFSGYVLVAPMMDAERIY